MYVYKAYSLDTRYIPPMRVFIADFKTEKEVIEYLENNEGGVYNNVIHNFDLKIDSLVKAVKL